MILGANPGRATQGKWSQGLQDRVIAGRVAHNSRKLGVLTPSGEDWF